MEAAKNMVLAKGLFMFVHMNFLHLGGQKTNQILNFTVQQILGRLICYIDLEKARPFVKDIYIVLTRERRWLSWVLCTSTGNLRNIQ